MRAVLLSTLLTLATACQGSSAPPPPAPSASELANATYVGVYLEPITFEDGAWEGEPFEPGAATRPRAELAPDFRLTGDLDGRPGDEAVVLMTENSGGSGSFVYLAVVGRRKGEIVNLGTVSIGDWVEIRSARILEGTEGEATGDAAGRVELRLVESGPGDGACCPSHKATRTFALDAEGLSEHSHEVTGILSLADIEGVEWVLSHLDWKERAPAAPELTLRLEGARITGSSGCNRYFAALEAGAMPGEVAVGPVGSTRMACPEPRMRLEQRYLAALGGALKYGFAAGRLYLLSRGEGGMSTLLFEPRPADPEP